MIGLERAGGDDQVDPAKSVATSDGDAPIMPRASWFVTPEAGPWPSVVLGLGSDRLSIPRGQALFATFSKPIPGTGLTPFVSLKYGTFDERLAFPFGANLQVGPGVVQALYDGNHTHLLWTQPIGDLQASLVYARTRAWGLQVSYGF